MLPSGYHILHAEAAFDRAVRARRVAAFRRRLRGDRGTRLPVFDERGVGHAPARSGRREIPLKAIRATLEPNRAEQFDADFRPAKKTRRRWERVWMLADSGAALPPIEVVPVDGGFALRDGHHRVSVARARGAVSIDANVAL